VRRRGRGWWLNSRGTIPRGPTLPASRADRRVLVLLAQPLLRELLIDCEEDRTLRAVLVGMLREGKR
jgi:hypothetical protein